MSSQRINFFLGWTLHNWEKNKNPWEVCMLFLFPSSPSDSVIRQIATFAFWKLPCKMRKCKALFPSWSSYCSVEGLGSHLHEKRKMIPYKVNDLVPSQRNGLGKFQGNIWRKALHTWSKLNVICTLEMCRCTWTKRKYSDNIVSVLQMWYNPGKPKIVFKVLLLILPS